MFYRLGVCLGMVALLLFSVSCKRLGEPGPAEQKLISERLPQPDSIPAKWGKLVSVSSVPSVPDWVQLWFQDDTGNVRFIGFNIRNYYLSGKIYLIRRD